MFEKKVMKIFGTKRERVSGGWRKYIMRSFIIYLFAKYYLGL
jgi:hypothetical protein